MFELTTFFSSSSLITTPVKPIATRFSSADSIGIDSDSAEEDTAKKYLSFDVLMTLKTDLNPSGLLRLQHTLKAYQTHLEKESTALADVPYFRQELHYTKNLITLLNKIAEFLPKLTLHHPIKDTLKLRLLRTLNMMGYELSHQDEPSPLFKLIKYLNKNPDCLKELNIQSLFPQAPCTAGYDLLLTFETRLIQAKIHRRSHRDERYDKKGFNETLLHALRTHRQHLIHIIDLQEINKRELQAELKTKLMHDAPADILKIQNRLTVLEKRLEFYQQEKNLVEKIIVALKSITLGDAKEGEALQELFHQSFEIGRNIEERLPKISVCALERLAAHLNDDPRFQCVYALELPRFEHWDYSKPQTPVPRAA